VPLPWSGARPPFGFGPDGSVPWLPQPASWSALTVAAQSDDPGSTLALYRRALRIRREVPGFRSETLRWRAAPDGVLDVERADGVRCIVNLSPDPVAVDTDVEVLVASRPLGGADLPPDTAVWVRPAASTASSTA
jgi:alpha-glucosidase